MPLLRELGVAAGELAHDRFFEAREACSAMRDLPGHLAHLLK